MDVKQNGLIKQTAGDSTGLSHRGKNVKANSWVSDRLDRGALTEMYAGNCVHSGAKPERGKTEKNGNICTKKKKITQICGEPKLPMKCWRNAL